MVAGFFGLGWAHFVFWGFAETPVFAVFFDFDGGRFLGQAVKKAFGPKN